MFLHGSHIFCTASYHHTADSQYICTGIGRANSQCTRQDHAIQRRILTFARAFLQLRQAFRVTDSGALRRFEEREELLDSASSFSSRVWRGSDPVLSDVD